jgi:hypothetical protein
LRGKVNVGLPVVTDHEAVTVPMALDAALDLVEQVGPRCRVADGAVFFDDKLSVS